MIRARYADRPSRTLANPRATPEAPHQTKSLSPPVRGLTLSENLALMQPGGALQLDNWWPTSTGVRLRGGCDQHATTGTRVRSMFTYTTSDASELFAATSSAIYNVTSPASPTVAPTADVTGRTTGYYSTVQFATAGGEFLYAVNGTDSALLYDGSAWTTITGVSTPAITGVTTSTLSQVWSYASRVWFTQVDTLNAWYLPVDSIGGAATQFSLAGVFKKGGSLLFGATWSMDAGDGLDDKCIFVSTEGEVAVYEGTDPSSAGTWRIVGVYQITKPLGINATMQAGGDLLIATELGILPVSSAIQKDPSALNLANVARQIKADWDLERARRPGNWELVKWPSRSLMMVIMPSVNSTLDRVMYVCHIETGAWARTTGWRAQCAAVLGDDAYFADISGNVYKMDTTGSDNGAPFTGTWVGGFDPLDAPGQFKTVLQARPVFKSNSEFTPQFSMSTDYKVVVPNEPNSSSVTATSVWDTSVWDTDVWFDDSASLLRMEWVSVGASGFSHAPQIQITSASDVAINVEIVSVDVTYQPGQVVV